MNDDRVNLYIKGMARMARMGFDPWGPLTHGYHESAGFQKVIGLYNFWGCKKPKWWTKKVVAVKTHEYITINDTETKVPVVDYFCDFDSLTAAFFYYERLIWRLYPAAGHGRSMPSTFFNGLVNGKFGYKWATDPHYEENLMKCCNSLKSIQIAQDLISPRLLDFKNSQGGYNESDA